MNNVMSPEKIEELEGICKLGSCEIQLNKNENNIKLETKGDARVIIAALLTAIGEVKKKSEVSDDEFNILMLLLAAEEYKTEMEDKNEENSTNN